jgi:hypothetical protein
MWITSGRASRSATLVVRLIKRRGRSSRLLLCKFPGSHRQRQQGALRLKSGVVDTFCRVQIGDGPEIKGPYCRFDVFGGVNQRLELVRHPCEFD